MKKKLLNSMRVLLVAAGLCVGAGNVWAEDYKTVLTLDFEDAETYTNDWAKSANYDATLSQSDHGTGKALHFVSKENKRGSTLTYSFSSISSFTNATAWKMEFDYATSGSNNSNANGGFKVFSGSNVLFSAQTPTSTTPGTTLTIYNSESESIGTVTVSAQNTDASPWLHIVLTGTSSGVYATVTNTTASPNTTIVDNVQISTSAANATSFQILTPRWYFRTDIDDIICSIDLEAYTTRATSAKATYTAINGSVMNPTEKSALDAAYTALTTNYDTDAKIVADIAGYASAITALETANANAQTSIDQFVILNELITNAAGVSGYIAPTGAETTFTSNPESDVDAETLTASVRAAIITAGTANENTDITALIANSSFELGNTLGWTTVASDDTGARAIGESGSTYYTSGGDGTYLFNTWSKGTPITQTIGTLPAGQYTLTAKVASNGATVYLTMNSAYNAGTVTSDAAAFVDGSYTFTLGSATEVTIGAVGGAGDGSFLAEGHWWYKADKFTLTYNGEDPLEQAKSALNDEITAATAVRDAYTSKVGTAPFLYPIATYNTLATEITEATAVYNGGSTTVSDYTTAQSELETAKDNMSSSTQNLPDADKYYRLFVASDGSASAYNLNLTKGKIAQVVVSSSPYPVKIVADGTTGRYYIYTPYDNSLCTNGNGTTAYTNNNTAEGFATRCSSIRIALNDNGTVSLGGYRSSTQTQYYSASASEGSGVTATTGNTGTWVISDAVDVTDITLSVNAAAGWGTFIAPYDNLTPSTVKAYTVSYTENNVVYFTENETGVLSANTPYILSTEEAEDVSTTFKGIANNDEDTYEVNGLVGLLTASTVPVNSYVLQYNDSKVGFYKTTSAITGTANRCYLDLTSVPTSASSRAAVGFGIYDGEATGINSLSSEGQKVKSFYNLNGQRVATPEKGLYIVNGKKVVLK